jgi:2-polyprenyl-3-methyl-5-hydroxy-6-metoxy-1,4-benzoquinol methylase
MKFSKTDEYYSFERAALVDMLPCIQGKVLEIGCGSGATLAYMKMQGASYVVGIDTNKVAIDLASKRGLDLALVLDVEKEELPFNKKEFDCIVLADVLEHLYNPWDTLEKVTTFLADNGHILISLPNIKHYMVLLRLVFHDEWTYTDAGTLDNSHIRFFTLKEIRKLLACAGLREVKIKGIDASGKKLKCLNRLLFNKLETFSSGQYYILAGKK